MKTKELNGKKIHLIQQILEDENESRIRSLEGFFSTKGEEENYAEIEADHIKYLNDELVLFNEEEFFSIVKNFRK